MLPAYKLRGVLPGLSRVAISGPFYRAVAFESLLGPPPGARIGSPAQPLWPGGPSLRGARFTPQGPPSFGSLYLALNETTPLLEVTGVLRPPNSPTALRFVPQVLMTVDGVLTDVLDLTDGQVQSALGTSLQELTGEWAIQQDSHRGGKGPMPPTQILGQASYDVGGIVGLKYRSSKSAADAVSVVVFSDRLVPGRSYLEVYNKTGGVLRQRLS